MVPFSFWSVPVLWPGETVFVLGGGPSLASQNTQRLAPRAAASGLAGPAEANPRPEAGETRHRVVAVNSSYLAHPFADFLFSADRCWLEAHKAALQRDWQGRVVTLSRSVQWDGLLHLRQAVPPGPGETPKGAPVTGLSQDPRHLASRRTSLQGGLNLAALLTGLSGRIVLLGADGKPGAEGKTHHHPPHPATCRQVPNRFQDWYRELALCAAACRELGIEILNASPGSAFDFWPETTLDAVLASDIGRPQPVPTSGEDAEAAA